MCANRKGLIFPLLVAPQPTLKKISGIRVALLGFCCSTPCNGIEIIFSISIHSGIRPTASLNSFTKELLMNTTISTAKFAALGIFMLSLSCLGQDTRLQAQETRYTAKPDFNQTFRPPVIKKTKPISLNERGILEINGSAQMDLVLVKETDCDIAVYIFRDGVLYTPTFCPCKVSAIWFDGRGGDDRFHNDTSIDCNAYGGDGDDILKGGSGRDILVGDRGDDQLFGRGGFDQLYGDQGHDELDGGDDGVEDWLHGSGGNDTFHNYEILLTDSKSGWRYWDTVDWIQDFNSADDVELIH
jgi:hypothetical protein